MRERVFSTERRRDLRVGGAPRRAPWQILLVVSSVLGSYLALLSSKDDSTYKIQEDISDLRVALGGFCVFLGARLADGCTSGHGITGMGHLTLRSMVAVRMGRWSFKQREPRVLFSCRAVTVPVTALPRGFCVLPPGRLHVWQRNRHR